MTFMGPEADLLLLAQPESAGEALAESNITGLDYDRSELLRILDLSHLFVCDPDGVTRFWSAACERLYGWSAAEILGRRANEVLRTRWLVPPQEVDAILRREGEWAGELVQYAKAGGRLIVHARKVLRRDAASRVVAMVESVTDVTSLHRTDDARRRTETKFADVFQKAAAGLGLIGAEGRWTEANERLCAITGCKRSEFVGRHFTDVVHPGDVAFCRQRWKSVWAGREGTATFETRHMGKRGDPTWLSVALTLQRDDFGSPAHVIAVVEDIGQRRQDEQALAGREARLARRRDELEQLVDERTSALADAETRFHAIFDGQFQLIALLSPDGALAEANRAALELSGLERVEAIGRQLWDCMLWADADKEWLRVAVGAAAQGEFVRREVELGAALGRKKWVDFSLVPVCEPGTEAVRWIIAEGRDITDRRVLETQLAQAQRLQALGQLAGGIAHDFNNILQAVSGAMSLVEQRAGADERLARLARVAQDAAQRGASITRRLLSFARRGELRAESLRVAEMLTDIHEVLAHTIGAQISVIARSEGNLPLVLADRGQLETSLVNLGTNARDAMPDGGEIILAACCEVVGAGSVQPPGLQPGSYIRLSVSDNGAGMDAATLSRASEPFFTTKTRGRGTGLGLAMVQGFVEQSGGALRIESTQGRGTTVTLWLPTTSQETFARPHLARATPSEGLQGRVLLVDDDRLVREVLAEQLDKIGFQVVTAASGAEAMALIDAGEAIDVLVSDLTMPGMSGIETIRQARLRLPLMSCFLLTGYMGERAALSNDGLFQLIRKPVSGEGLAVHLQAELMRGRLH